MWKKRFSLHCGGQGNPPSTFCPVQCSVWSLACPADVSARYLSCYVNVMKMRDGKHQIMTATPQRFWECESVKNVPVTHLACLYTQALLWPCQNCKIVARYMAQMQRDWQFHFFPAVSCTIPSGCLFFVHIHKLKWNGQFGKCSLYSISPYCYWAKVVAKPIYYAYLFISRLVTSS